MAASLPPAEVYVKLTGNIALLDFTFIIFYESVNVQFGNKYKDAAIRVVEKF